MATDLDWPETLQGLSHDRRRRIRISVLVVRDEHPISDEHGLAELDVVGADDMDMVTNLCAPTENHRRLRLTNGQRSDVRSCLKRYIICETEVSGSNEA
jgi:hypothetical protein